MGKTSNAVKDRYNAKNYDDLRVRVPKGMKEAIQAHAEANGETVNGFINRLINDALGVHKTADADADI
jgi:predicted HicB family RNase H-like nuclease